MARVKKGVTAHRRHKKILKMAKGYRGSKSKLFKKANETVMKALFYARRDRRKSLLLYIRGIRAEWNKCYFLLRSQHAAIFPHACGEPFLHLPDSSK